MVPKNHAQQSGQQTDRDPSTATTEDSIDLETLKKVMIESRHHGHAVGLIADLRLWPTDQLSSVISNRDAVKALQMAKQLGYHWIVIAGHLSKPKAGVFAIHVRAGQGADTVGYAALLAKIKIDQISPVTAWVLMVDQVTREMVSADLTGSP